jgi:hypothetical protein
VVPLKDLVEEDAVDETAQSQPKNAPRQLNGKDLLGVGCKRLVHVYLPVAAMAARCLVFTPARVVRAPGRDRVHVAMLPPLILSPLC